VARERARLNTPAQKENADSGEIQNRVAITESVTRLGQHQHVVAVAIDLHRAALVQRNRQTVAVLGDDQPERLHDRGLALGGDAQPKHARTV
jgi:hypothetical protein